MLVQYDSAVHALNAKTGAESFGRTVPEGWVRFFAGTVELSLNVGSDENNVHRRSTPELLGEFPPMEIFGTPAGGLYSLLVVAMVLALCQSSEVILESITAMGSEC